MTYPHLFFTADADSDNDTDLSLTSKPPPPSHSSEKENLLLQRSCSMEYLSSSSSEGDANSTSVGSSGVSTPTGSFFGSAVCVNSIVHKEEDDRSCGSECESEDLAFVTRRRGRRSSYGLEKEQAVVEAVKKVAEEFGRCESPEGLIPIHKKFSKLVSSTPPPRENPAEG